MLGWYANPTLARAIGVMLKNAWLQSLLLRPATMKNELGRYVHRTIRQVQQAGRRQWKKDSGYHQQARMENAFFRYKLIIGESLRARSRAGQETEAILACNILNQMTQLGRPASYAIGR